MTLDGRGRDAQRARDLVPRAAIAMQPKDHAPQVAPRPVDGDPHQRLAFPPYEDVVKPDHRLAPGPEKFGAGTSCRARSTAWACDNGRRMGGGIVMKRVPPSTLQGPGSLRSTT